MSNHLNEENIKKPSNRESNSKTAVEERNFRSDLRLTQNERCMTMLELLDLARQSIEERTTRIEIKAQFKRRPRSN